MWKLKGKRIGKEKAIVNERRTEGKELPRGGSFFCLVKENGLKKRRKREKNGRIKFFIQKSGRVKDVFDRIEFTKTQIG